MTAKLYPTKVPHSKSIFLPELHFTLFVSQLIPGLLACKSSVNLRAAPANATAISTCISTDLRARTCLQADDHYLVNFVLFQFLQLICWKLWLFLEGRLSFMQRGFVLAVSLKCRNNFGFSTGTLKLKEPPGQM